jgi:hypothetical protein
MGRYLSLWTIDWTKIPVDPKERKIGFDMLMGMVKEDMKKGIIKDWGAFLGGYKGYSIMEGNEVEVMKEQQQYTPFVNFEMHPIGTVPQVEEMLKALTK